MNDLAQEMRDGADAGRQRTYKRPSRSFAVFAGFMAQNIDTDKGPFSFNGYGPLEASTREIVEDKEGRPADIMKPTQCGFTTVNGFGLPLWEAHRNARNVLYYLPTDLMRGQIMKARLIPALAKAEIRGEIDISPSDGMMSVAGHRVLWLGLDSPRNALSWPADLCIYDEVDHLDQENLRIAKERLGASDYGREIAFACARTPGEGMHGRYLLGDQRRWVVRCDKCRTEQILEDYWPENAAQIDGEWLLVCMNCRRPINPEADGRFMAQRPDVKERMSFQVSALAFGKTNIGRIMREWNEAKQSRAKLADFRCSVLGLPDAGDRQALTGEDILRALRPRPLAAPLFAGIDVGDICRIAVCGPSNVSRSPDNDETSFVHFEAVRGDDLVEKLKALDREMHFGGVLIDQKPEGSLARAVCRAFPTRSWMQEFRRKDEAQDEKELDGEKFRKLVFERDETAEHFCDQVKARKVWLPAIVDGMDFLQSSPGQHFLAGSQKEERRDSNGITHLRFRAGSVENHHFMAAVFAHRICRWMTARTIRVTEIVPSGNIRSTAELGIDHRVVEALKDYA